MKVDFYPHNPYGAAKVYATQKLVIEPIESLGDELDVFMIVHRKSNQRIVIGFSKLN